MRLARITLLYRTNAVILVLAYAHEPEMTVPVGASGDNLHGGLIFQFYSRAGRGLASFVEDSTLNIPFRANGGRSAAE